MTTPAVGDLAPDFSLRDQHGQQVRLSSYRGRSAVALVFYPFAFSGTCTGELCEIRDNLGVFAAQDVTVLACSVDHMFTQRAYADAQGLTFAVLSDFWPHGAVASSYGVFDERAGAARRGTFLIDVDQVVRWNVVNGIGQARDFQGYLSALSSLRAT
ncbi:MAG TPA: peroxiredoxin [Dermatophilaceae bacterium]|nr:peroxiredoxin [Dermatophilaceae bacterium]